MFVKDTPTFLLPCIDAIQPQAEHRRIARQQRQPFNQVTCHGTLPPGSAAAIARLIAGAFQSALALGRLAQAPGFRATRRGLSRRQGTGYARG